MMTVEQRFKAIQLKHALDLVEDLPNRLRDLTVEIFNYSVVFDQNLRDIENLILDQISISILDSEGRDESVSQIPAEAIKRLSKIEFAEDDYNHAGGELAFSWNYPSDSDDLLTLEIRISITNLIVLEHAFEKFHEDS
jgi:hypothetical protein